HTDDALYAHFNARARTIAQGSVGGADALTAEIVASDIPQTTFKSLAAAIGKATGLDADAFRRAMVKARSARDSGPAANVTTAAFSSDPAPASTPAPVGKLLGSIVHVLTARVRCSPEAADAVALW